MYTFLDYFFNVFHDSLVLFSLTGWAWKRTRRIHLITTGLTILSWFGLGVFCGWGYCPSTDWHWGVKRELGETNLPNSYVKYYVDKLTGFTWDPLVVDTAVLILGLLAFALSCWLNLRHYNSRRDARHYDSSLR
ncbi:MAG: DUF2784 domain-containing protein [Deltaproteobacteria bacterium]|nr:DUF2784 domain-containing protein [Deltaproteobacteria bacterium]